MMDIDRELCDRLEAIATLDAVIALNGLPFEAVILLEEELE